jgi:hypothetical protein
MGPLAFVRRFLLGLFGTALGMGTLVVSARSNELVGSGSAHGIVIHDAESTLRDFCRQDEDGVLWLTLPKGERFELVTSPSDPVISNPGDGAFHPYAASVVRDALRQVNFPLSSIGVDIYLLPYPRRGGLDSAAGAGLILLAPGVRPLSDEHQHAEFVHELGHVVQYALFPDADMERWERYRALRGIQNELVYSASAPHADRPHEIFAEDFRALFGDVLANYSNSIENSNLTPPAAVSGLAGFMVELAGASVALELAAAPNPGRGMLRFSRAGLTSAPLDVFDVTGRRLASVMPAGIAGGTLWAWDGRDAAGRPAGPGMLFARVRGEGGRATRVTLLP